jgi:hypothetical protein
VEAALNVLLFMEVLATEKSVSYVTRLSKFQVITDTDMKELQGFYSSVVTGVKSFSDLDVCEAFKKSQLAVTNVENFLITCSRTAKLWIQYIHCVHLLNLNLYALSQMLPLFAAAGHNNYAKSGRLYLQIMQALPVTYPQLYNQFTSNKNHAIRKSNKYWAGLSTDLAIEQLMMKPLKSRGLTHGRGLTDNVREMWVSTMHHMAAVHAAVNS